MGLRITLDSSNEDTRNDVHVGEGLIDVHDGIDAELEKVTAVGAYDLKHWDDEIADRDVKTVIPNRKDSKL